MKAMINKTLVTLIGIVLVVPFCVVALLIGAGAARVAQSAQDEITFIVLAVSGVVISLINGSGNRRASSSHKARRRHPETRATSLSQKLSWALASIKPLKLS